MILVAPTSFKGTHDAAALAHAIAAALGNDAVQRPLSDGGPGLISSLLAAQSGVLHHVEVTGPYGEVVRARILEQSNRVVVESADACGLHLSARREPMVASTHGVAELINAAARFGKPLFVGLGGSATVDGGAPLGTALQQGLPPITALCDVRTRLHDAARIFGPQKGASAEQVGLLASRLVELAAAHTDAAMLEGAGAAGGLGFGLHVFAGATLVRGSEWVMAETGIETLLAEAELVVTGEGAFDAQSSMGKITGEIIARSRAPVILIAGSVEGQVPGHVHAVAGGENLSLDDVARLASECVSGLLAR
jgi:glycerate kinase